MAESLLVGSVAGEDSEQVFRTAGRIVGDSARRLPDGETGERSNWIGFQIGRLAAADGIEFGEPRQNPSYEAFPQVRLTRPAEQIELGELGYAAAARSSYATFRGLKQEGVLSQGMRFQVSLPTPLAVVNAWVALDDHEAFEPVYERALLDELAAICSAIPHDELAIQWDVAAEIAILEGAFLSALTEGEALDGIISRLERISEPIPPGVELGFHLCWGDYKHEHFVQPKSLELAVDVANRLASEVEHPIAWVHMPVPVDRKDDEYFQALRDLRLADDTELYLGVVHHDGLDGTQARIDACRRVLGDARGFGVATECGMGRTPREQIEELLRIHAEADTGRRADAS